MDPNDVIMPGVDALLGHTVAEVERALILRTLQFHFGNRTGAARALGVSVRTLRNKIRQYTSDGIAVPHSQNWRAIKRILPCRFDSESRDHVGASFQ
jgi:hypothetical protein